MHRHHCPHQMLQNIHVRSMLHARSTVFASIDAEGYKEARYDLRRSIREAKRQYIVKLEGYYTSAGGSQPAIIKFADDTTVIGLITGGAETDYREEVAQLVSWCHTNNLSLNAEKTKEMIIDLRKRSAQSTSHR